MGRQNWFAPVGEEHRAARERVALFDESSFAKYELVGRDAVRRPGTPLRWRPRQAGGARDLYADAELARRHRVRPDADAARADRFYLVTGTGFRTHDAAWIRDNIPPGLEARLVDVTEDRATLALMGPRARALLARISQDDLSNEAFAYAHAREIAVAGRRALALRITYVGELGWELHMANADAPAIFDALMNEGAPFGISVAGYRAIESLRLEKAYRAWGADITANDNPYEAGLGFAVHLNRERDFIGRDALLAQRGAPLKKRIRELRLRGRDNGAGRPRDDSARRRARRASHAAAAMAIRSAGRSASAISDARTA